jgi:hypothetical protein
LTGERLVSPATVVIGLGAIAGPVAGLVNSMTIQASLLPAGHA